jgi:DNA-binding NarL/FixJ family response regulator
MSSDPTATLGGTDHPASAPAGKTVWLATADEETSKRICNLLGTLDCSVIPIRPGMDETEDPWEWARRKPEIVVLDIGGNVDWGCRVIDTIQRKRRETRIVVLTGAFSREFGAKIVSRGLRYVFPHDFCPGEFLEVMRSLAR